MLPSRKLFSVGFVSVLVVLAAVSGVTIADMSTNSGALAQNNGDVEPNDDRQNATRISTGEIISGDANETEPDVDWYAFNVSAGDAFNVNHAGAAPDNVSVYGPDGDLLSNDQAEPGDIWVAGGVAEETGTYYVRITGSTYDFDVQTTSPDSFEPNDDRQNAASIEAGEDVSATLFEGEQDWYAIETTDGQNLSATVERLSGASDPAQNVRVDVFDSEGNRVGESIERDAPVSGMNRTDADGADPDTVAIQRVNDTQAGTYYVRISPIKNISGTTVESFSGYVEYSLAVNTSGGAEQPTETLTETPTETPTDTETPQETTETPTETETPDETPEETETETPTDTPTETPSETDTPEETSEGTETPSETPTEQPTEPTEEEQTDSAPTEQIVDIGQNDEDDDGDGHVDEDGEDGNDVPSNDDDGDGAVDEDDEPDDGDDGSDDFNAEAEDDDDGDGHFDEDDEEDGGNSDDEDNDGDGAVDEDDEPDNDD